LHLDSFQILAIALSGLIAGLSKSALPGTAILMVPLMASAFPAKLSVGLSLPILIAADIVSAPSYRFEAAEERRLILTLLAGAVVGIGLGCLLMERIDGELFRSVIGWVVLSMLGLRILSSRRKKEGSTSEGMRPSLRFLFGIAAGTATALANVAGPIISLHMIMSGLPKRRFIAASVWFFLVANVLKVPFYWSIGIVNPNTLKADLIAAPFVALGVWSGLKLVGRIKQNLFITVVTVLTFVAAIRLILN